MLNQGMTYEEVVSPIVTARLRKVGSELKGKFPGALNVHCSVRHNSRGFYEATVSVDLKKAGTNTVVAHKESKNVFAALNDATKAVLRQLFSQRDRRRYRRRHGVIKGLDLDLPLAS